MLFEVQDDAVLSACLGPPGPPAAGFAPPHPDDVVMAGCCGQAVSPPLPLPQVVSPPRDDAIISGCIAAPPPPVLDDVAVFSRESFGNRLVSMLFVPTNRVSFNFFPLLLKSICMKKPLCTPCILFGHSSRIHPCWSPFGWFSMGLRPHNGQPKSPVLMNKYQQNIQIFEHLKNFMWHNLISWQIFQLASSWHIQFSRDFPVLSPKSANLGSFRQFFQVVMASCLGPPAPAPAPTPWESWAGHWTVIGWPITSSFKIFDNLICR